MIAFTVTACTEKLEVGPNDSQNLEEVLKSEEGLQNLRNGAYAFARRVYTRYFFHFADLLADTGEIFNYSTYSEFRELKEKMLVSTFTFGEYAWEDAYTAINNCNLILNNIDVVETDTTLEAHARFIRGLLYFDLTRFYALPYGPGAMDNDAVPLMVDGVSNPDQISFPSKASVGEVFDLVENDLKYAFQNLIADEPFFASKYSAAAILSRYFLTIENYDSAAFYANEVIESEKYVLSENIFDAFNNSSYEKEDVFAWQQTALDNEGEFNYGIAPFYASTNEGGRSEFGINPDFIYSVYDSNDTRGIIQEGAQNVSDLRNMYYIGFGYDDDVDVYTAKWLSHKTNINMVRLAEMYLTRAEANQMILDNGGTPSINISPVDDIAVIRQRAGLDISGLVEVNINDIRMERYKELIFEGHRVHDNKRWKRTIYLSYEEGETIAFPYNSKDLIIPIPKKELDANPNL